MKVLVTLSIALFCALTVNSLQAQAAKSPAQKLEASINGVNVTIDYCSPSVRGREIWGGLVPYDQVWRTGANNATKIVIDSDVKINGKALKAGTYGLFTIPGKDKWTVIFNTDSAQWGAYSYTADKDVLRVEATPSASDDFQEAMSFVNEGNNIVLKWENLKVGFNVSK